MYITFSFVFAENDTKGNFLFSTKLQFEPKSFMPIGIAFNVSNTYINNLAEMNSSITGK